MTIFERLASLLIPVVPNYYYGGAPQDGPVPYMVATQIHREMFTTQDQPNSLLREWDFQFSSWGTEYSDARTQTTNLVNALVGFKEWATTGGITAAWFTGEKDLPFSDDPKLYGIATFITLQENLT